MLIHSQSHKLALNTFKCCKLACNLLFYFVILRLVQFWGFIHGWTLPCICNKWSCGNALFNSLLWTTGGNTRLSRVEPKPISKEHKHLFQAPIGRQSGLADTVMMEYPNWEVTHHPSGWPNTTTAPVSLPKRESWQPYRVSRISVIKMESPLSLRHPSWLCCPSSE